MFCKTVNNDQNGIELIREGEFNNEVCCNFLPGTRRGGNWLKDSPEVWRDRVLFVDMWDRS